MCNGRKVTRIVLLGLLGTGASAAVPCLATLILHDQDLQDVVGGVSAFHDRRDLTDFALTWPRPIVVISGDHDRTPSPATAAQITAAPNRELHLVDDCGHYVNLEQPDRFRNLLADAIHRVSGQPQQPAPGPETGPSPP